MSAGQRQVRYRDYLFHMLDAVARARSYVQGMSRHEFLLDAKTQDAVVLKLLVVGEAATQFVAEAPELAAAHTEIPWKQMRGMRNRMAHGYFEIDMNVVWDTVANSLPDLEAGLRRMLDATASDEG